MLAQWTHVHSGRGRRDEGYAWARQYEPLLIKANKPITTAMCPSIQPQEATLSFSEDTIPWRGTSQPLGADSLHSTPSFMERAAICFLNFFKLIFLEIGEGKKKGRERLVASYMHWPGTEPATQACALTRTGTGNILLCRMMPNQLSHTSQDSNLFSKD